MPPYGDDVKPFGLVLQAGMCESKCMETSDTAVARNITRVRALRRVTQDELAGMMRSRGHDWHQSTVYKLEAGKRGLQLVEAVDLANCLRVNLWELHRDAATSRVREALNAVDAAYVNLLEAHESYEDSRRDLERLDAGGEPEEVQGMVADALAVRVVIQEP